jgi:branched-chain amino acid transport system substrate-binding protein
LALAAKRIGAEPDSYEAQATDWASLVILSIAKAKAATGTAMKDNVRKISQGSGQKVYSAVEGLKALAAGGEINYEGASGPCDFTDIGDILDCKFRYNKIEKGKPVFLTVA